MLDFRIDTFLAVCRFMNFTRAAETLHITQPAVSQHIHWLEEKYHCRLFTFQGKKMALTPAGEALLSAATTMKHDALYLEDRLRQMRQNTGRLVFGATLTIGEFVIPKHLARFLERYPDVSVRMVVANTQVLLKELDAGEIDFALVEGYFAKSEYDSLVYAQEPYIGVCGASYPLPDAPFRMEDLLGERLIVREAGSGTREVLERYLEGRNCTLRDFRRLTEAGNLNAIKSLVEQNCGVTFLYEAAAADSLRDGKLRRIPLVDFHIVNDFTFIWRKNSAFAAHYHELFQALHEDSAASPSV